MVIGQFTATKFSSFRKSAWMGKLRHPSQMPRSLARQAHVSIMQPKSKTQKIVQYFTRFYVVIMQKGRPLGIRTGKKRKARSVFHKQNSENYFLEKFFTNSLVKKEIRLSSPYNLRILALSMIDERACETLLLSHEGFSQELLLPVLEMGQGSPYMAKRYCPNHVEVR